MSGKWFEIDRKGLAEIAKRRGMAFIVTEPIQNAWDEPITRVEIDLVPVPNKPFVDLTVVDDAPDGFRDLADSYMMFRSSYKIENPEQRGRFNIGEKLLLAVAIEARITTTTGSVIFASKGRTTSRKQTARGSILTARLRMTRDECAEALRVMHTLIPPEGIVTTINGEKLRQRTPVKTFRASLDTELQGGEGGFKHAIRKTDVMVYECEAGEEARLYEMGIPVDTLDCRWHVSVEQKVPLSLDRASARYGYQRKVSRLVAEAMADRLTEDDARSPWVSDALETMEDDGAVREIVKRRFGKAVVFDPSSPEASKRALDAGYKVVHGGELSKAAWRTIRGAKALEPAGKVFDTGVLTTSEGGVTAIPRGKWSDAMETLAVYVAQFTECALGDPLGVEFYDDPSLSFVAACGRGNILLNLSRNPGRDALTRCRIKYNYGRSDHGALDALLIHECAHVRGGDHLTDKFYAECCRIGAEMRWWTGTLNGS